MRCSPSAAERRREKKRESSYPAEVRRKRGVGVHRLDISIYGVFNVPRGTGLRRNAEHESVDAGGLRIGGGVEGEDDVEVVRLHGDLSGVGVALGRECGVDGVCFRAVDNGEHTDGVVRNAVALEAAVGVGRGHGELALHLHRTRHGGDFRDVDDVSCYPG